MRLEVLPMGFTVCKIDDVAKVDLCGPFCFLSLTKKKKSLVCSTENAPAETMDALIPKKALMELVKISRDAKSDVSFGEDPNHIYFEVDGRLLLPPPD